MRNVWGTTQHAAAQGVWIALILVIACFLSAPIAHADTASNTTSNDLSSVSMSNATLEHVMVSFNTQQDKDNFVAQLTNPATSTRHMLAMSTMSTTATASGSTTTMTAQAEQPVILNNYDSFPSVTLEINQSQEAQVQQMLQNYSGAQISPVQARMPLLMDTVRITNATGTWPTTINRVNLTGIGQGVCVIDMGINTSHEAFTGKNIVQHCFCSAQLNRSQNCCPNNLSESDSAPEDFPHGSHVAGIVGANGSLKGIAPGSDLVIVKVFGPDNSGQNRAYDDDIASAIQWCTSHATQYHIKAISMSLGDDGNHQTYCNDDPLAPAINAAVAANIPVVVAAGNQGYTTGISAPACVQSAIPVAFTTKSDAMSSISSRNSLVTIVAPGENIYSVNFQGGYMYMTGSSQATPHVAGAIAILSQALQAAGVSYTPDQFKQLLTNTGKPITDPITGRILHRLDIRAALNALNLFPPSLDAVSTSPTYPRHGAAFTLLVNTTTPLPLDRRVSSVVLTSAATNPGSFAYSPGSGMFSSSVTIPSSAGSTIQLSSADSEQSHTAGSFSLTFDDIPPSLTNPTIQNASGSTVSSSQPNNQLTASIQMSDSLSGPSSATATILNSQQQQVSNWTLSQRIGTQGWSGTMNAPSTSGNYTVIFVGYDNSGNAAQTSVPLSVLSTNSVGSTSTGSNSTTSTGTTNTTATNTTTNTTTTNTTTNNPADTTPPTTTVSLHLSTGALAAQHTWYNQTLIADFTATDSGGSATASGVAQTFYRLGSTGHWIAATSATISSTINDNTLYYYSVDNAGNAEQVNTASVLIDKTNPELTKSQLTDGNGQATSSVTAGSSFTAATSATDTPSGIDTVAAFIQNSQGQTVSSADLALQNNQYSAILQAPATTGNYVVNIIATDLASNSMQKILPLAVTASGSTGSSNSSTTNATNTTQTNTTQQNNTTQTNTTQTNTTQTGNNTTATNTTQTNTTQNNSQLTITATTPTGATIEQTDSLTFSFSDLASGSVSVDGQQTTSFVLSNGVTLTPADWGASDNKANVTIGIHASDAFSSADGTFVYLVHLAQATTGGNSTTQTNITTNQTQTNSSSNTTQNSTNTTTSQNNTTQTNTTQTNSTGNTLTNTTISACGNGAISNTCTCGGTAYNSGYCCNGGYSTAACQTSSGTIGGSSGGSSGSSGGGGYRGGSSGGGSSGGGFVVSQQTVAAQHAPTTLLDAQSNTTPTNATNTSKASPRALVALDNGLQVESAAQLGTNLVTPVSPATNVTNITIENSSDNASLAQRVMHYIPSLTDLGIVAGFVVIAGGLIVAANLKKD